MRWIALFIFLLFASVLSCHPLDDQAQMESQVVLAPGPRLEYVVNFRYVNAIASMSEFENGLDANGDSFVTRDELSMRYVKLTDELMGFSIGFSVDGQRIEMEPDFDRFEFRDMNGREIPEDERGLNVTGVRIHYRFVFYWDGELEPGPHKVEYYFSGIQTVVHTPEEQMVAIDARVQPQQRITNVTYDKAMEVFPRLIFEWRVPEPAREPEPEVVAPAPEDPPSEAREAPEGLRQLPAWLTFTAGLLMVLIGIGTTARRAFVPLKEGRRRKVGFAGGLLFVLVGAGIVLAALVRLGLVNWG